MSLRAYQQAAQRSETPRDAEYRLFAQVTRALMDVKAKPRTDVAAVSTVAPGASVAAPGGQRYSPAELRAELRRFEHQLRAAGLKETSVTTYVDRTGRFLKWLEGDYQPRGPN